MLQQGSKHKHIVSDELTYRARSIQTYFVQLLLACKDDIASSTAPLALFVPDPSFLPQHIITGGASDLIHELRGAPSEAR